MVLCILLNYLRIEVNADHRCVGREPSIDYLNGENLFSSSQDAMLHMAQVIEQLKKETLEVFVNIVIEIAEFKYQFLSGERALQNNESKLLPEDLLSKREKEVLNLVFDGLTNKEIAERLFISFETVKSHRKKILNKTDSKNTAALMRKINPSDF